MSQANSPHRISRRPTSRHRISPRPISRRDVLIGLGSAAAVLGLTPLVRAGAVGLLTSASDDASLLTVQAMADAGCFGELTYASAAIADAEFRGSVPAALAHIGRWMKIGRDDRIARLSARREDDGSAHVLLRTSRGRLIELRNASRGGPTYALHGTRGAYRREAVGGDQVYLHGRTRQWEALSRFVGEFETPLHGETNDAFAWRSIGVRVRRSMAEGGRALDVEVA